MARQLSVKLFDGQITKNFSIDEMKCKGTGELIINADVIDHAQRLQRFRDWYNRAMKVNSWYRNPVYNASTKVKGGRDSQHLLGLATDIALPKEFYLFSKARKEEFYHNCRAKWFELGGNGFGFYRTFMHMDSRKGKRWDEDMR